MYFWPSSSSSVTSGGHPMKACTLARLRNLQNPSGHGLLDAEDEAVLRVQGSAHSAVGTLSCTILNSPEHDRQGASEILMTCSVKLRRRTRSRPIVEPHRQLFMFLGETSKEVSRFTIHLERWTWYSELGLRRHARQRGRGAWCLHCRSIGLRPGGKALQHRRLRPCT